jgi:hypothetical protein
MMDISRICDRSIAGFVGLDGEKMRSEIFVDATALNGTKSV